MSESDGRRDAVVADQHCYNTGCLKTYREDEECVYHSGRPYFHDAYKIWTCCEKRSTDFSTFLSIPGCSRGKHNNVPPLTNTTTASVTATVTTTTTTSAESVESRAEPSPSDAFVALPTHESPALKTLTSEVTPVVSGEAELRCSRCGRRAGQCPPSEECVSHAGAPVFHETLKFWSCCPNKKSTFFDEFEAVEGCVRHAAHQFVSDAPKATNARLDWFQTGADVTLTLFMRGARAQHSRVLCNGRAVRASLAAADGRELLAREWSLAEAVDVRGSHVQFAATKVEIVLRKWTARRQWTRLEGASGL